MTKEEILAAIAEIVRRKGLSGQVRGFTGPGGVTVEEIEERPRTEAAVTPVRPQEVPIPAASVSAPGTRREALLADPLGMLRALATPEPTAVLPREPRLRATTLPFEPLQPGEARVTQTPTAQDPNVLQRLLSLVR